MDIAVRQGAHKNTVGRRVSVLILAQALEGKDVKDLLLNVGSGGGAAPAAGGAAAAAGGDAPAAEEKKEEKEEGELYLDLFWHMETDSIIEKEESDEDMGFGLFD